MSRFFQQVSTATAIAAALALVAIPAPTMAQEAQSLLPADTEQNLPPLSVTNITPSEAIQPKTTPQLVTFDTAVRPGEKVGPGEVVRFTRYFDPWHLICTKGPLRTVCLYEQPINSPAGTPVLVWDLAQDINKRPYLIAKLPNSVEVSAGLKIKFDQFTSDPQKLHCGTSQCMAIMPFEGRIADWILNSQSISFVYSEAGKEKEAIGSLKNLKLAIASTKEYLEDITAVREKKTKPKPVTKSATNNRSAMVE